MFLFLKNKGKQDFKFSFQWISNFPIFIERSCIPHVSDNTTRFAFADKLKEFVHTEHPEIITLSKEEQRPYFIKKAKEECKKDKNIWCSFFPSLSERDGDDIVVTDLRFKHEDIFLENVARMEGWNYIKMRILHTESEIKQDRSEKEFMEIVSDCYVSRL